MARWWRRPNRFLRLAHPPQGENTNHGGIPWHKSFPKSSRWRTWPRLTSFLPRMKMKLSSPSRTGSNS